MLKLVSNCHQFKFIKKIAMYTSKALIFQKSLLTSFLFLILLSANSYAEVSYQEQEPYTAFKGKVVDSHTGDDIALAMLNLEGTNISTITNSEGEFSIKIPGTMSEGVIRISFLGYQSKSLPLSYFKSEDTKIELSEVIEELPEINLTDNGNAKDLINAVFKKSGDNYSNQKTLLTAFYRETIQKRRRNVSLSEAVVKVLKQPYTNSKKDQVSIYKARKRTDYERLDTLALKLRGGPYNTVFLDVMKYPTFLFSGTISDSYTFKFDKATKVNNKLIYVVNFTENDHSQPWYSGKMYVDSESLALIKATFSMNVDDRDKAAAIFVQKKPNAADVYPVDVVYQVDYRESNGKWYYSYSRAQLEFVVNWKNKLFNSRYTLNGEMAVTNREKYANENLRKTDEFINTTVVMVDDVSGFTDMDFWGDQNIIEPEKSIQSAIEKIQRKLEREID